MLSVSDTPESEESAKSTVTSVVVSLLIVSVEVVVFPATSVEVIVVVNSPSLKVDKSTLSIEYSPVSELYVISFTSTVTVFVPSVIVRESIVLPASTVPDISLVATSLALITLSPPSSVMSVVLDVVVSIVNV